jgi:cupin 2 domain-containing protein
MVGTVQQFFEDAAPPASGERFDVLLQQKNVLIERIVSSCRITPTLCVQTQDEWVLLVQGSAVLEVDGVRHELRSGDHLFIAAHVPHTVLQTAKGTIWLAVHIHPG